MATVHHMLRASGAGTTPPAIVTYIGRNSDTNNLTTYTFSGQSIGTASSDRIVVVTVQSRGTGQPLVSLTIDGNGTNIIANTNSVGSDNAAICYLEVPSGTTADIVVTFTGAMQNCGIAVFTITQALSSTPIDSDLNNGASPSVTLNTQNGGVVIANLYGGVGSTAVAWTDATEQFDVTVESLRYSGAMANTTSSSLTVSATVTGGGSATELTAASWR